MSHFDEYYQHHIERCPNCISLAETGRPLDDECEECFHPAHRAECEVDRGDREGNEGNVAQARGPCPCRHVNAPLSDRERQLAIDACAEEAAESAWEDAQDRKYQEWKDRDIE